MEKEPITNFKWFKKIRGRAYFFKRKEKTWNSCRNCWSKITWRSKRKCRISCCKGRTVS